MKYRTRIILRANITSKKTRVREFTCKRLNK